MPPAPGSAANYMPTSPMAAMMLVATLMLAASAEMVLVPGAIALILMLYMFTGVPRLPEPRAFFTLLMGVPFALWWRYGEQVTMNSFVPVTMLFLVGLYMLALGTHHVLSARNGGNLDYALACAVMGVGLSGAAKENVLFVPGLGVFAVLLIVHLRYRVAGGKPMSKWRLSGPRFGAAVAAVLLAATLLQVFGVNQIDQVNRWLVQRLLNASFTSQAGFDRNATLSSISSLWSRGNDEEVALRVFAEQLPTPYLRGASYDRYRGGVWQLMEETTELRPAGTDFGRNVFDVRTPTPPAASTKLREFGPAQAVVYSAREFSDAYFLPNGAHRVAAFAERAFSGAAETIKPADDDGAAGGYAFYTVRGRADEPSQRDTYVPGSVRSELIEIGDGIMASAATPRQKIQLLQHHFIDNFEYQIGITLETGTDPIIQFLTEIRKAHCEYFATAGVLLLRTQGIPARYVTGFVVDEPGIGDVWIARRKNAHAWVEAYLPEEGGWVTIEMTPASARPATTQRSSFAQLMEWLSSQWQRFTGMLFNGGFGAFIDWLLGLPARLPLWVWGIAILGGMVWVFRVELRRLIKGGPKLSSEPRVRQLQMQLREAERMLARHGLTRPPSMTVGSYLTVVDGAAKVPDEVRQRATQMLRMYQEQRFRGQ